MIEGPVFINNNVGIFLCSQRGAELAVAMFSDFSIVSLQENIMAWNNKENIVKKDGKCWNSGMHKYCSYWRAKHNILMYGMKGSVIGYRCSLFEEDKEGYSSLSQCNKEYGLTYDGRK